MKRVQGKRLTGRAPIPPPAGLPALTHRGRHRHRHGCSPRRCAQGAPRQAAPSLPRLHPGLRTGGPAPPRRGRAAERPPRIRAGSPGSCSRQAGDPRRPRLRPHGPCSRPPHRPAAAPAPPASPTRRGLGQPAAPPRPAADGGRLRPSFPRGARRRRSAVPRAPVAPPWSGGRCRCASRGCPCSPSSTWRTTWPPSWR